MKGDVLALENDPAPPAFAPGGSTLDDLDRRITSATDALLGLRQDDGHWCFELEADATIPSEYVLFRHFRGEPEDRALEREDRRSIFAASRARTAAGRSSTTAIST